MKKFFAFAAAIVFALSLNATKVVFDFTKPADLGITAPAAGAATNLTDSTVTVDGVAMTCTDGGTATRVWNSSGNYTLRVYKNGGSLTFTAAEDITAIEFAGSAVNFNEFTGKTWNGTAAKTVTLNAKENSTISSITLTVGEAAVVWTPDTITVSETAALIAASDAHDHFVKGVVMDQPFITYSNFDGKVSFWMKDAANPNDTIQFYNGMGKDNAKWGSLAEAQETLRIGDTVLVYAGGLEFYSAKNFNEITGGYYVETLGKNPNPPVIAGPDTITVAKAVEIAQALAEPSASGQSTTDTKEYVVLGYAVSVYDKNTDGTWSFYMHDEIGQKGDLMASNTSTDADVAKDDQMYVRGYLAKRKTNAGNIQLQIYKGTGVHAEAGVVPDTISAAEAKATAEALEVGAFSAKLVIDCYVAKIQTAYSEEFKNISVWLTDDPTSTYGDIQAYRASISAEDGPSLASGDHILVEGRLSHTVNAQDDTKHYYQVAQGAQITVVEKAQGIENVVLTEKAQKVMVDGVVYIIRDNKMFDVMGTQVR